MEFEWKQVDGNTFEIYGYGDIKIAVLYWNEEYEVWELKSDWFKLNDELFDEDVKEQKESIKKVKISAIEQLLDTCKEEIDWYKKQIDMLYELYQDTTLH